MSKHETLHVIVEAFFFIEYSSNFTCFLELDHLIVVVFLCVNFKFILIGLQNLI